MFRAFWRYGLESHKLTESKTEDESIASQRPSLTSSSSIADLIKLSNKEKSCWIGATAATIVQFDSSFHNNPKIYEKDAAGKWPNHITFSMLLSNDQAASWFLLSFMNSSRVSFSTEFLNPSDISATSENALLIEKLLLN
jgi:hypothetical protein